MNIDIRKSIIDNFNDASKEEYIDSIETSLKDRDEITLPGLGVFFEIIWINASKELKDELINILIDKIKST